MQPFAHSFVPVARRRCCTADSRSVCDADICRRASGGAGGGGPPSGEEGEQEDDEVDRFGLPTHWYQPPFSRLDAFGRVAQEYVGDHFGDE